MIHEVVSNKEYRETIEYFRAVISRKGFGILWEINFKDKFEEKGLNYPYNYMSFSVCNPQLAIRVLERNQDLGHFLPCKISIFESEQGVKLGLVKPTVMMQGITSDPEILELAQIVEDTLVEVITETGK